MVTLFFRHNVADYAAWRKIYDDFDSQRRAMGVLADAVYQAADNPNDVTVTHDFASLEAAKAFGASRELHEAMANAGVDGRPTAWFATRT
jgi:hypothetical protein